MNLQKLVEVWRTQPNFTIEDAKENILLSYISDKKKL